MVICALLSSLVYIAILVFNLYSINLFEVYLSMILTVCALFIVHTLLSVTFDYFIFSSNRYKIKEEYIENISNSFSSAEIAVLTMLFVAGVGSIFCVTIVGPISVLVHIAHHILSNLIGTRNNDSNIE